MCKKSKNPCRNIVSFRVTDLERQSLEQLSLDSGMNVSTLMREIVGTLEGSFSNVLLNEGKQTKMMSAGK
ncbi:hypothetical protein SAMN05660420_02455 [Desulfuromusa kysingii]|uniref:Ribbon-helix-helix protein, copG family n=1 Tax=Desulfuromusa kysingii TaxID=37625 RepID=A0A1H4C6K7_9BACT|nr:hypothetical protein [Desulfuromusa kysingii]SEA55933.1 hypothetical protein SAMN05660420_02455 [Desulfuromusa kysingii]